MATATENEETCCCGHRYSEPGYERSSHYCPVGKRPLGQECATNGKGRCPSHKVPVRF